jgi:hypothetical protein
VRIAVPATGETFEVQLEEDEFHMLWLNEPNRKGRRRGRYLLSAVLKIGWRVVRASPEEQAVLDAPRVEERKGAVTMELSLYSIVSAGESPCPTLQRL